MKPFQEHSQTPLIKVGKTILPSVLIGTSPFLGAGQFKEKAYTYREKFLNHPKKMAEIFIEAVKLGVPAIQLIPLPTIVEALKIARKETNLKIAIVGSLLPNNIQESLETLTSLEPQAIMIHGAITDKRNPTILKKWINKIKEKEVDFLLKKALQIINDNQEPWTEKNFGRPPYPPKSMVSICLLKVYFGMPYRDLESLLRSNQTFQELLELKDVPDHNTIQRAMEKIPMNYLQQLNQQLTMAFKKSDKTLPSMQLDFPSDSSMNPGSK